MKDNQPYMAPEWHGKQQASKSGDLFALAVLLFFMMIGSIPFNRAICSDKLYRFICRGDFNLFWTYHLKRDLSKESKNLLYQLFQHNPKHRLLMVAL
jgi:serine/threonine protein kinase